MTRLYLGLTPPDEDDIVHYPVIRIEPRLEVLPKLREALAKTSHLIVTSKTTVKILCETLDPHLFTDKKIFSVGQVTTRNLESYGLKADKTATTETAEGVIQLLEAENKISYALWPHSALARPLIREYLDTRKVPHSAIPLYDTVPNDPGPLPQAISEIIFTSPSTVDNFYLLHPKVEGPKLSCIGPITEARLHALTRP